VSSFDTFGGEWDARTVTPEGAPVHPEIDGVLTRTVVTHVDHRGRLFEVANPAADPDFWSEPIVHSYVFTIRANTVKGWGVHREKSDRYCLISGETMTILFDARTASPTYRLVQEVALSPEGTRMVLIPPGVWHMSVNVAPVETVLINFPTRTYDYESPDRLTLPWHSSEIPVDVSRYFPRQSQQPPDA
jgi:dTDP-4-dehydrorhamnose 3,5-epimerase-like enzyme